MDGKKEWCAYSGETACNCEPGQCRALEIRGTVDSLNMLIGYGLSLDEAAEDVRKPETNQ